MLSALVAVVETFLFGHPHKAETRRSLRLPAHRSWLTLGRELLDRLARERDPIMRDLGGRTHAA
jgi:hypothetical protein